VCVAVSGRGDSVALFHVLNSLKELLGFKRLSIVHVNPSVRGGESDADALFVKNLAQGAGLNFFLKELKKPPGMTAGRMGAPASAMRFSPNQGNGRFFVHATGHTGRRPAEPCSCASYALRAQRLRSLLPVREDGVIRPLLYCQAQPPRWLAERKIEFRKILQMTTSASGAIDTARGSSGVLPQRTPNAVKRIAQMADHARIGWSILQPAIKNWMACSGPVKSEGTMYY